MFNLNTEIIAECVKSLADNNRCISCDKLNTPCLRYPCGHAVCAECVDVAECCLLCVTPPLQITYYNDKPLSRRVENASQLVLAYQELFSEDVNKRVSISKQQKLEKLLFPECIQVSNQYFNKRKFSSISQDKENINLNIVLPGKQVTNRSLKMENKNSYVRKWLNDIQSPGTSLEQRKPIADLNVNTIQNTGTIHRKTRTARKRKHFKTTNVVPAKKYKGDSLLNKGLKQNEGSIIMYSKKCEADESGIVMEDDIIEILDSQEDKDKLACKAVEEADLYKEDNCMDLFNDSSYVEQTLPKVCMTPNQSKIYKVPFYRKSSLYQTCKRHQSCYENEEKKTNLSNVSISIENKSFLTMINVSSCTESYKDTVTENKNAVLNKDFESENSGIVLEEVQKNFEIPNVKNHNNTNMNSTKEEANIRNAKLKKGITISDSDSDSNFSFIVKEVTIDVHRPCNEADYGTLSVLNNTKIGAKHARRENTPTSTDSSDKENYDPNRMKRKKGGKKCFKK